MPASWWNNISPTQLSDNATTSKVPEAKEQEGIFGTLASLWNNISPTQLRSPEYEFFFKDGTTDYAFKNYEKNYRLLEKNENRNYYNTKEPQDPKLLEQNFLYLVNKYATNSDFRALLDDPYSEHKLPELAFSLTISHLSVRQNQTHNNEWLKPEGEQKTPIPNNPRNPYPKHPTNNPTSEVPKAQATIQSILSYISGVFSRNKENTQEANGQKNSIPTSRAPSGPSSPAENPAKTSSTLGSNWQITETAGEKAGRRGKEAGEKAIEASKKGIAAAREARAAKVRTTRTHHPKAAKVERSRMAGINNNKRGGR